MVILLTLWDSVNCAAIFALFGWGWPFYWPNLSERRHQAISAESPQKLLTKWQQGDLTVEQAIGQILQHLAAVYKVLDDLKQQLLKLLPKDKK